MDNMTVTISQFRNVIAPLIIALVIQPPNYNPVEALKSAIVFEYIDWTDPENNEALRRNLLRLSSDLEFFVLAVQTMEAHSLSRLGRSYLYEFTAEPPTRFVPTPDWFQGAYHADDVQYVFGAPFINLSFNFVPTIRNGTVTSADKRLSLAMMTAWTNFAKSGLVYIFCTQRTIASDKIYVPLFKIC